MYANPQQDEQTIRNELGNRNVHPDEIERLVALGGCPETIGEVLLECIRRGLLANPDWLVVDQRDPRHSVTNPNHVETVQAESRVCSGITINGVHRYGILYIGGTEVDAPTGINTAHVNTSPEDMRFPAEGPRVLIDGRNLPFPTDYFERCEGYHIPFDFGLIPDLIQEIYRVLQGKGVVFFAPSTNVEQVTRLLTQKFQNVTDFGPAPRTAYLGRPTRPTRILSAEKTV